MPDRWPHVSRMALVLISALGCLAPAAWAQDRDRDGMSDALEAGLATDPGFAETLEVVAEGKTYKPTPAKPARYDVARMRFGNVAKGRWLWAIEFAEPYSFDNASLILYLDADDNRATGRKGIGCEVMYGCSQGKPWVSAYAADGTRGSYPGPRIGLERGVLYIGADIDIKQAGGRSKFSFSVLSEMREPHKGIDNLRATNVDGPGDSERTRAITLADQAENENFEVTQSMELLWKMHADSRNLVLNAFKDCQADGFEYNHSEYRWPSMRMRSGEGKLTARVPKAGRYYLGAVVYDGLGRENFEMAVQGQVAGRFVAHEDNRRQRLFFLPSARDFKPGQTIVLRASSTGAAHVVEDIVLLAEKPPVLKPECKIRGLEVEYDRSVKRMRATWITTWPVACILRYGDHEVVEEEATQNHRVYLPQLEHGKTYKCKVRAKTPEGEERQSASVQFAAGEPKPPKGIAARERIELGLLTGGRNLATHPLTAGVPFPQAALGSTDHLRLLTADGHEWVAQAKPIMHWPDGSVKVALLDTIAPKADRLSLEYGYDVRRTGPTGPNAWLNDFRVQVQKDTDGVTLSTPTLKVLFDRKQSGLFTRVWCGRAQPFTDDDLVTDDARPARFVIVDDAGKAFDTLGAPESIVVEEPGPMRAVVRLDGHHTSDAGRFFTYQIRVTLHATMPFVKLAYRWGNDVAAGEFSKFRGIRFELPLRHGKDAKFLVGTDKGAAEAGRVTQLHDDQYELKTTAGLKRGKRAPGWVAGSHRHSSVALFCRHFWQLYPKAIGAEAGALRLDICPEFGEKQYNDCSEIDLLKLYYYLQDGRYKVRQGMTKVHEITLMPMRGEIADVDAMGAMTSLLNEPPTLAASPDWYAHTGAFSLFIPKTAGRTPRYDDVCDRSYDRYIRHRDSTRAFGMLNFGDQFGERRVNYSNGEYDHHHTAAQMFLRSADPGWYRLMEIMARHDIDVDLCHYHTNPRYRGASWVHSMGHTGRYFKKQYKGEWGTPGGGMSVSHTWCEGTCEYYALTGDPSAVEAARSIADHYGGTYLNHYDFTNGRIPGWHLLLTMAVYRATYDPFYLNAARIIVDRVLERRTPGSGWARQMVPGHCHCTPRCRGACSFMQGILGCGLREYYLKTEDPRLPQAVTDSARYLIEQMWVDDQIAFRYTSCPESSVTASRTDTLAGLLLFAYELSGDTRFLDVARRGMNEGLKTTSSMAHMRWTPYIICALDRIEREGAAIQGGTAMCFKADNDRPFQIRLFDRSGQGAPADAAELVGPLGKRFRPGPLGRIMVDPGKKGGYRLSTETGSGPWLVKTTLPAAVASTAEGLALDVSARPARVFLTRLKGQGVDVTLHVAAGSLRAELLDASGKRLDAAQGSGTLKLSARPAPGQVVLRLSGPARLRLSATGVNPWAALWAWEHFNASAPTVTIQGDAMLLPGQGRTIKLRAQVEDPENDAATVRWELPGGKTTQGNELAYTAKEQSEFDIRAVATDRAGNTGSTTIRVKLPPAELSDLRNVLIVQAEALCAQGGGKVRVYDRIGNVGKMITYWHEHLGHWLEWKFRAPTHGTYVLYARYASGAAAPARSLTIDGRSPGAAFERIAFKPTGGYCTERDNWALKKLGPPVRLDAGEHHLRMTNLGDGLAMDYLAIAVTR